MQIRPVYFYEKNIINQIADTHIETFEGFFLTFLGKGFLTQMYSSYCEHKSSELLVCLDNDNVVGFLSFSKDMSGLYKFMIKKHLIKFAFYSLCAFFKNPKILFRVLSAFAKPSETKKTEKYIELSSIGVKISSKNKGIGSKLIKYLCDNYDFSDYEYITLETDAENNDAANNFYKKNGFVLFRTYCTKFDRKMNEYRLYIGENNEKNMVN